jgi:pyruvate-ferredoxin/flavodoxin oxidoreductase
MMQRFADLTGRAYQPFAYAGDPNIERVVIVMGSGSQTVRRVVSLLVARGERVGVVTVHLYRPFDARRLLAVVPRTVQRVAVLDRTKEPGSPGEPLFLDVAAFAEGWEGALPFIANGRYGLSSKEFTPAMAGAVFASLATASPKRRFSVGIVDDVTHLSLCRRSLQRRPRDGGAPRRSPRVGQGPRLGASLSEICVVSRTEDCAATLAKAR